jgi:lysophospholipase L1-like esterase
MKDPKTNRIYSFFIFLALLFWNPLTFYLLYADTPAYPVKIIKGFYWLVFLGGIVTILLINRGKISERKRKIVWSLAFIGFLFSIVAVFNAFSGKPKKQGLIFEPNTQVRHKTVEFDYTTITDANGLRNKPFDLNKGNKFRILCVGDSWTFGWGVNMEDSYAARLEEYLRSKGYQNVEVINCGQPGTYTAEYATHVEKLVPVLKPDLVLVGVLQIDDLAQIYENSPDVIKKKEKTSLMESLRFSANAYFRSSFDNILANYAKNSGKTIDIKSNWEESANEMINKFSHMQQVSFHSLEDTVQKLFLTGNLNPSLMEYYINFPDRVSIFNNPNHAATKFALSRMEEDLAHMHKSFDKTVFVNMPQNMFTGHKVVRTPNDVLDPYFASNNKIDSMYHAVADKNKMPYIELTQHFLGLDRTGGYFFLFDGHPTPKGYEAIARYVGDQLIAQGLLNGAPPALADQK